MAWVDEVNATQLVNITGEQIFDEVPQLNPGESAVVAIDVNFPGGPTDDLVVGIYTSLDGATWDTIPYIQFVIDKDSDNRVTVIVDSCYQFRIGVQRSGATDTITSADMSYRLNGVRLR